MHRLKARGQEAEILLYPGAAHAFDARMSKVVVPTVDNAGDWFFQGPRVRGPFGGVASGCLRKGAHIGGDAAGQWTPQPLRC